MQSFQTLARIAENHTLTVEVPPEFPTGEVQVVVTPVGTDNLGFTRGVENGIPFTRGKAPRASLAEWAVENSENWGDVIRSDDVEGFTGRRF